MKITGYLAAEGYEKDLEQEIALEPQLKIHKILGRLHITEGPESRLAFAQDTWSDLKRSQITSITHAAKELKNHGKFWVPYSFQLHRRTALIQDKLPKIKNPKVSFGEPAPQRQLGSWTLENENTLWLSSQSKSAFPLGEVEFEETKEAPSRAYLKLWEFFTIMGKKPKASDICIDLGSSPGGWTWVLSELGSQVISVDKAPLAEELLKRKNIRTLKKDAFTLRPQDIGPVNWLFSDIICYPEKLLELVKEWQNSGLVQNFVCTIKFQGETDFKTLQAFKQIPNSQIHHLSANKHEVTWSLLQS